MGWWGAEPPGGGGPGEAQGGRARRPPRPSPKPLAATSTPSLPLCVPEAPRARVLARVEVYRGGAASADRRAAGPVWMESIRGLGGACAARGPGRSAPGSPDWQAGQSEREAQRWGLRAPGGSRLYLQPYHPEHARSPLISQAKQGRACLILGWETAWDYRVLSSFLPPLSFNPGHQALLAPHTPPAPVLWHPTTLRAIACRVI